MWWGRTAVRPLRFPKIRPGGCGPRSFAVSSCIPRGMICARPYRNRRSSAAGEKPAAEGPAQERGDRPAPFSDWCRYCSIFKILRQSGKLLCINAVALKMKATIFSPLCYCPFPSFRTQITITAAVAMKNSANITGFPIMSVS